MYFVEEGCARHGNALRFPSWHQVSLMADLVCGIRMISWFCMGKTRSLACIVATSHPHPGSSPGLWLNRCWEAWDKASIQGTWPTDIATKRHPQDMRIMTSLYPLTCVWKPSVAHKSAVLLLSEKENINCDCLSFEYGPSTRQSDILRGQKKPPKETCWRVLV